MAIYIELGALLLALFLVVLVIRFFKNPAAVIANSILGMLLFFVLNTYLHMGIEVNFWSVAIVALGGVGGFLLVLALNFMGIAF
jgi:hypothetical protein